MNIGLIITKKCIAMHVNLVFKFKLTLYSIVLVFKYVTKHKPTHLYKVKYSILLLILVAKIPSAASALSPFSSLAGCL